MQVLMEILHYPSSAIHRISHQHRGFLLPTHKSTVPICRILSIPTERLSSSALPPLRSCRIPTTSTSSPRRRSIWACAQAGAAGSDPLSEFQDACWRFLRPHTIRGTALGSIALVVRALIENSNLIKWSLLFKAFSGVLALICGNGYIVGINQIYDIAIDKVNKPYLPIAAGDLSVGSAWLLVLVFAAAGLSIVALNFGPFITSLYCLGLFLGTIYSVPPFRMKRFPIAAFLIIATLSSGFHHYVCNIVCIGHCHNKGSSRCGGGSQVSDNNIGNKTWCSKYCIPWFWAFAVELFWFHIGSSFHSSGFQAQLDDSCACYLRIRSGVSGMVA